MSKKDEALKLALKKAFDLGQRYWQQADSESPSQWKKADVTQESFNQLIEDTIREALAEQPAQPIKQGWDVDDLLDKPKQPAQQQEPVAYMGTDIDGNPNKFRLNPFGGCVPLYEKPQSVKVWDAEGYDALCQQLEGWKAKASKPWVGLTDKEWQEIDASLNGKRDLARIFVRAIEAKLKGKNA